MEILITLLIMSVMMGVGFNYIMSWLPKYHIRQATRDVYTHLQLARIQAIKQHVCCTISFTKSGNVVDGYELYADLNCNRQRDVDEMLLTSVSLTKYDGDVDFNPNKGGGDGVTFLDNSNGKPTVTFKTNGMPLQGGGAGLGNGSVYLLNNQGLKKRIVVNQTGRIRIESNS